MAIEPRLLVDFGLLCILCASAVHFGMVLEGVSIHHGVRVAASLHSWVYLIRVALLLGLGLLSLW